MIRPHSRNFRAVIGVVVAVAVTLPSAAIAAWSAGGSGGGGARAAAIGAPTAVTAVARGSGAVAISWSAPGAPSPTPTSYAVSRTTPGPTASVCTVAAPATTCLVTGLSASTSYTFQVVGLIGLWSGPSASASATTPAAGFYLDSATGTTHTAGASFQVRLVTDVAFAGVRTVTFSGPANAPNGQSPTYPSTVTFDADGIGLATITLYKSEAPTLTATASGPSRTGTLGLTVTAGTLTSLQFTSSSSSCAAAPALWPKGDIWSSRVTAYDVWTNPGAFPSAYSVGISLSGDGTLVGPSPVTIAATARPAESSSFNYRADSGNGKTGTLTASVVVGSNTITASCAVKSTN